MKEKVVVSLDDYPGYLVVSERGSPLPFAQREVLPFSSREEKDVWCDLHWNVHGKTGGAGAGQRWSRVCPAPVGDSPKFAPWRDANMWSGCAVKQFVGYVSGAGAFVELAHKGPGACVVGDGRRLYPVHLDNKRDPKAVPKAAPIIIDGDIAHAFGVYPDGVAHAINQFPRLLRIARNVPANSTTLLVHDTRLWKEWVEMLQRRLLIPEELKIRFVPNPKSGTSIFKTKHSEGRVYFAGEAVPVFPDRTSVGWFTLAEETCAFQLAINRTYVADLLSACPDHDPPTREISAQAGTVPVVPAATCVVEVLVVSRQDAKSRSVSNHAKMVETILAALDDALAPGGCAIQLRTFVGKDHTLASSARVWRRAHVVIAPHGAALANVIFVQRDTLLVELGYYSQSGKTKSTSEKVGMPWPANYYWAAAEGAGSTLFASMAVGSYGASMTANLLDIHKLMTHQIAPRLLNNTQITRRHLQTTLPPAKHCPPSHNGEKTA